jgi:hypothetical protein
MRTVELGSCTITLVEDDLVHTHFKDGRVVSVDDVKEMFHAMHEIHGDRKVLLMVTVGEGTAMSNEARAYASSEDSNHQVAADAIVVRDFGHQLAANVFVRHHRPARPIQMFPDKESALAWLREQKHLVDGGNNT